MSTWSEWRVKRYARDPEYRARRLKQSREWKLKSGLRFRKYGITKVTFERLSQDQDHKCFLCEKERKLVIDHDHVSNTVRGLLCDSCNTKLGWYEGKKARIAAYLDRDALVEVR